MILQNKDSTMFSRQISYSFSLSATSRPRHQKPPLYRRWADILKATRDLWPGEMCRSGKGQRENKFEIQFLLFGNIFMDSALDWDCYCECAWVPEPKVELRLSGFRLELKIDLLANVSALMPDHRLAIPFIIHIILITLARCAASSQS